MKGIIGSLDFISIPAYVYSCLLVTYVTELHLNSCLISFAGLLGALGQGLGFGVGVGGLGTMIQPGPTLTTGDQPSSQPTAGSSSFR